MCEKQSPPSNIMKDFILNLNEPTIVHKGAKDWNLLEWNLKDWSEAMDNSKLPFRIGNRKCCLNPQWETTCRTEELTMDEFIQYTEKEFPADEWMYFDYKYMNEWFKDHKSVLQSVSWAAFGFPEFEGEDSTIWIGSEGAHTPCHSDSYSLNIVAQIYGKKMWIMFPPKSVNKLQPTRVPYEESSVYSNINFSCGNSDYSGLDEAYFVILEPGDVLIVPNQWWHYVENVSTAISINTWIPLDSDSEKRIEESLVKNFVMSCVKDLSPADQKQILNPNENNLVNNSDPVDIEQLNFCIGIHKNKPNKDKEMMTSSGRNENNSAVNLDQYKNIQTVNRKSMKEIISLLRNKCKCNKTMTNLNELKISKTTVSDYINAFCHPDIVSKVKEKLLNK